MEKEEESMDGSFQYQSESSIISLHLDAMCALRSKHKVDNLSVLCCRHHYASIEDVILKVAEVSDTDLSTIFKDGGRNATSCSKISAKNFFIMILSWPSPPIPLIGRYLHPDWPKYYKWWGLESPCVSSKQAVVTYTHAVLLSSSFASAKSDVRAEALSPDSRVMAYQKGGRAWLTCDLSVMWRKSCQPMSEQTACSDRWLLAKFWTLD